MLGMLDDIGGQDKIQARILERQITNVSAIDRPESFVCTKPDRFLEKIEPDNPAISKFRKHPKIGCGACAAIKDRSILRKPKISDLATKQAAPTDEAPVRFFDVRFNRVDS